MYGIHPLKTEIMVSMAKKGLNRKSLSEQVGVSPSTISNILNSRYQASPKTALKVSQALGVELEDIFLVQGFQKEVSQ